MNITLNKKINKIFATVCAVTMLGQLSISSIPVSAATAAAPKVTYTLPSSAKVGDIIDIGVNVSGGSNLYGGAVDFSYDPSLIQVNSVDIGTLFDGKDATVQTSTPGKESIGISLTGTTPGVSKTGTLATIKAKVLKEGILNFKTSNDYTQLGKNGITTVVKLADVANSDPYAGKVAYDFTDASLKLDPINNLKVLDAQVISENIPTSMEAGKTYPVSITVKNTGSETWTQGNLIRLGVNPTSNAFGVNYRQLLSSSASIATGQTATFNFNMIAPSSPGSYPISVQMLKEGVAWFGPKVEKSITVTSTLQALSSQIVSENIPTSMEAGKTYPVSITVKNTGSETWTQGKLIKLGVNPTSNAFDVNYRQLLSSSASIAPGQTVTFNFNMTAPSSAGSYPISVQMLKEAVAWFGPKVEKSITVTSTLQALSSQIVSENIPTSMEAGKTYSVSITVKNTGSETWTQGKLIKLGVNPTNNAFGVNYRQLLSSSASVAPGQTVTFNFNMTAPSYAGTYPISVQMLKEAVAWFGPKVEKSITVK
ncbi:NBR1-Ig-like domain-containing protein [Clostridium paraputrificum]|uniref:NBR1-Ig-like domain-containing protein n=1 Tax=Clostridium paraputrificum TaxID=29363 RepID=UPI003D335E51